jgi:glucose/arabinose dehydrogenase
MDFLSGERAWWRRPIGVAIVLLLTASSTAVQSRTSAGAATTPAGFTDDVVWSGLDQPTAIAFAPDGRVFVAEKRGVIKLFTSRSATAPTVFADYSARVNSYWDRGLLGLATDPLLGQTGHNYIYVLYTYDAPPGRTAPVWHDTCPSPPGANTDGCVVTNVLSRIPVSSNGTAGAEQRLLGPAWCQQFPSHSAAHLAFGPDGMLYASAGDGASYTNVDYGQYGGTLSGTPTTANPCSDPPGQSGTPLTSPTARGGALRSQSLRRPAADPVSLDGALLRLNPATGAGVPGNPAYSSSAPQTNRSRILAYGMRNPFRFTGRPGTSEVWVGDVGDHAWEEVDRVRMPTSTVAPNLGWPCYEGSGQHPGYAPLNQCQALYADTARPASTPYFKYLHGRVLGPNDTCPIGTSSISGLAFAASSTYPSNYAGALFLADYSRNCIWVMFAGTDGLPDPATVRTFVDNADNPYPVDLEIDPLSGDLFYVNISGSIHRISYGVNQPPVASATATPTNGPTPLTVQFDGSGSSDPTPGESLTYSWDLNGDGVFGDSTEVNPTFTYTAPGRVTATLRVTDSHGAASSQAIALNPGNTPPRPVIDTPSPSLTWAANDQVTFSAHADDDEDGGLPASAFSWQLLLFHCPDSCHTHFVQTWNGRTSGSFAAPDHEYPSYLVLQLTVTDSGGLSSTASVRLDPRTTTLNFASSPSGLQVVVDGTSTATPFSRTVIVNSRHSIEAPSPQNFAGKSRKFVAWSDRGAQTHTVTAPASSTTYTAVFNPPL